MKPFVVALFLLVTLVSCRSARQAGPLLLAPEVFGDGSILVDKLGEPLFPTYAYSCGDKSWTYPFGDHKLSVSYNSSLWVWHWPLESRQEPGTQRGSYPLGHVNWTILGDRGRWIEDYSVVMDHGVQDVAMVESGHMLLLGETTDGETILESWRFEEPYGLAEGRTDWIANLRGDQVRVRVGTLDWDGPHEEPTADLNAVRTELLRADLGGSPECFATASQGRFLFLLTRNRETKRVVLHQLDLEHNFEHTVLATSDNTRMLATCTDLSVRELTGSNGFVLNAFGTGDLKNSKGTIVEHLSKSVWLKNSNGDGVMDAGPTIGRPPAWPRGLGQRFEGIKE